MRPAWTDGNRVRLLENGEEYYPRVFEAIARARREVLIETFILFDDKIGKELQARLIAAARRGVHVELTVDGFGSSELTPEFIAPMRIAGVHFHVFDPQPKLLGLRTNIFRRLHRKLAVVDGAVAFVGGINFSHDHVREFGPEAKHDYAVEVAGPVVEHVHALLARANAAYRHPGLRAWWARRFDRRPAPPAPAPRGGARVALVTRDNGRHSGDIESMYRAAIGAARRQIVVANAYFLPGYRLLRDLRQAARRGVDVRLVLQGKPDMPTVRWAGANLYDYLLHSGVRIYEYCERPFHGKVAVVDDDWATVGSSNLDPLSLFLNLEANVVVRDAAFAAELRGRLFDLIAGCCTEIEPAQRPRRTLLRQGLGLVVFHSLRRFPSWAGWLPAHKPRYATLPPLPRAANRGRALRDRAA
ncbi:MAG: cardiolipin synthase ClsB [Gammaproteobacteria bacterium]|nr:cardiolipin synthase ClsB [Gammaproteobacteria bacterium]